MITIGPVLKATYFRSKSMELKENKARYNDLYIYGSLDGEPTIV